jgi:hypothetical protein
MVSSLAGLMALSSLAGLMALSSLMRASLIHGRWWPDQATTYWLHSLHNDDMSSIVAIFVHRSEDGDQATKEGD